MNFGTPVPLLIGIILILGALALFFLEKVRPGYERDSDKVYAVLLLISGLFLLAHLDMELLASFQQLLMAGMLTTLLIESIRNRLPKSDPLRPPTEPMVDRRPPARPRYDDRPPVRRGYRAELDDRPAFRDRPPADLPPVRAGAPRMNPGMNPAQAAYWPDDYPGSREPRQPYEEYRGPAGRLQPSPPVNNAPSNGRPDARTSDRFDGPPSNQYTDNAQYGQRPPAPRPPVRPTGPSLERASERSADYPVERRAETYQHRSAEDRPAENRPNVRSDNQLDRSPNGTTRSSSGQSPNGDRTLNVRPYSEAPKLDDDYRPSDQPERA
ncbi:MAG: Ycf66 family protein [Cyanobacteria bacterium P01_D01_bin.1]